MHLDYQVFETPPLYHTCFLSTQHYVSGIDRKKKKNPAEDLLR